MTKKTSITLSAMLESFFRQRLAAQRKASPATVSTYRDALRLLLVFASERMGKPPGKLSIEEIDRDLVLSFLDHLEKNRGNCVRTRNARLMAIRGFFTHVAYSAPELVAHAQRILSIPGKRTNQKVIDYLRQDEIDAILDTPDQSTRQGRRDYVLLLFMVRTGCRVSEAIGVNVGDLRLVRPHQVLLRGKGSKERVVPFAQDVADALRELLAEREDGRQSGAPIFVNARCIRLSRFGVNHILKRITAKAAISLPSLAKRHVTPHTLRHTTAMQLLQAGVDLTTIQSWLGHASVNTTHGYVDADLEMKRQALDACDFAEAGFEPYQPTDEVLALLEKF